MIRNTDNFGEENIQEKPVDIKKILYIVFRQWYWFLAFGFLGFSSAYIFNKLTKPNFSISTSILVPEKSKGLDMKNLFEGVLDQSNNKIYNEIEIVKSYFVISKTLLNLNWRTTWSKKEFLIWNGIYKQEPFDVLEPQGFINPAGIKIFITPTSGELYTISAKGQIMENNKITGVSFDEKGTFDQPFKNKYFNFTILKKVSNFDASEGKYSFQFNDLNAMTLDYQKNLKVVLKEKKGDIILCTLESVEPAREVDFLNELINVFIMGKMNLQNEANRRSLNFINTQLSGISDSLKHAGKTFTDFRSKNKIIDLGTEGTIVMNNLKELETERAKSQLQLDYFKNLLSYLSKSDDLTKLVSPSVVGIEDASLNMAVLKLSELYNRRQVLSFSAKEKNPTLVLLDKELTQTRNRLNENLRNLIDNVTKSIKSMEQRQSDIGYQLDKLPEKEQQMISIQREFTLTNEVYTFLLQRRAETNIALAASIPDAQIIDIARGETATPIGLTHRMILIIGIILGLAIPSLFIILKNFFEDRIRTQEDVENNTELPILGSIMHNLTKSDLAVFENPKSNLAESFRALRTNLQFMLTAANGKVISIHSTNPSEGKSFSAINLATVLAMNNKKVLLIGADLRKPRVHKIFDLQNEHGLSTYLIGYDTFEQIVFPTRIENLSAMTSGPIPPNPSELLEKPEMKLLIEKSRLLYDYIILDNAPVALVTDGIIVSHLSDLNIFILRYGVSHKHQIEIINQFADQKRINHIGLIINDIKTNSFGYTYYKYYQYEAYQNSYYSAEDQGLKRRWNKRANTKSSWQSIKQRIASVI